MKHIIFDKITIQNFLSIGETPVEVEFKEGLNIITGANKDKPNRQNMVGKSTIADAINFVIFGETIRELKKEFIPNNVTNGKCRVQLKFHIVFNNTEVNYTIVRELGPSKCYIFKENEEITRDSIANTNSFIVDLINSSPEIFESCIIMTINNTTPFMAKKKIEKRKFIEGILNLEVFSRMLQEVKKNNTEATKAFDIECARYEENSNSLISYKHQKENEGERNKELLKSYKQRIKNNLADIKILEVKLSEIPEETEEDAIRGHINDNKDLIKKIDNKLEEVASKVSGFEADIRHNNNRKNKLGTSEDVCPVCAQEVTDNTHDHIEELKIEIDNEIKRIKKEVDIYEGARTQIKQKKREIQKSNDDYLDRLNTIKLKKQEKQNIKTNIRNIENRNKDINLHIQELKESSNQFDVLISECEDKLKDIQVGIDEYKKQIHKYDIAKFIVSEEGVKAFIVKKILQLLNGKLAYYLKKMDANCMCVFNEYFEEQIINDKGVLCSYHNFSGAERKNIDLACLFSFMDIRRMQGDVIFNFSVYDELFDSSLDAKGIELVLSILHERIEKYNECIMVISHRKESKKMATGEIIFLEKENGVTTRVANSEVLD